MPKLLEINLDSAVPKNVQVEQLLRRLIASGRYADGDSALPREIELAEKLRVSRHTIRQAMARLVEQGLVRRHKNRGSFVNHEPVVTNLTEWSSFSAEMTRRGLHVKDYATQATFGATTKDVLQFMRIKQAAKVLLLRRVRGDATEPIVVFESFLHPRLGLDIHSDFARPLYELIEATACVVVRRSVEQIGAILCDEKQAILLQCDVGEPVLIRQRQTYDADDQPVEFCNCYYRASRFRMGIELRRNRP